MSRPFEIVRNLDGFPSEFRFADGAVVTGHEHLVCSCPVGKTMARSAMQSHCKHAMMVIGQRGDRIGTRLDQVFLPLASREALVKYGLPPAASIPVKRVAIYRLEDGVARVRIQGTWAECPSWFVEIDEVCRRDLRDQLVENVHDRVLADETGCTKCGFPLGYPSLPPPVVVAAALSILEERDQHCWTHSISDLLPTRIK
jgi:hypothetical protein